MSNLSLRFRVILILVFSSLVGDLAVLGFWQPRYLASEIQRERNANFDHLVTVGDAVTPLPVAKPAGRGLRNAGCNNGAPARLAVVDPA